MLIKRKIPISKVILPDCKSISTYLQDIKNDDASCGKRPLLAHLKSRFQKLLSTGENTVSILSNGSHALTNTLMATGVVAGKYCIMPSWCCASIAYSAFYAGLKPFFIDVDSESWTLDAKKTLENLASINADVGAVIVPSSFGKSINVSRWDEFTAETKIPVVIDASNSFDSILSKSKAAPSSTPIVMGFNAKSTLCFGEGGVVVCKDTKIIEKIERICKFGLNEQINELFSGTNGLMSEYNAAVCHVALDSWVNTRAKWNTINNQYIEALIETTLQHMLSLEFISATCNLYLLGADADDTIKKLKEKGIESTKWLGNGCHNMQEFKDAPKTALPITEHLISSVIGLPFYLGMSKKDIEYTVRALSSNVYGNKEPQKKILS